MIGALENLLKDEICRAGPMPFSRFMETALYHPEHGYYMRAGEHPAGRAGDYVTAPEMTSAFGALVAQGIRDWGLGVSERKISSNSPAKPQTPNPKPYEVWEFGAGRGKLARDVLAALPEEARPSRYVLVENHPSAREAKGFAHAELRISDFGFRIKEKDPSENPQSAIANPQSRKTTLVLANEFLDALPADVFRKTDAGWETLHAALDGETFAEAWKPTEDAAALSYLEKYASHAERGQRVEMAHGIGAWLDAVAGLAPRVLALAFDYGGAAHEVYAPVKKFGTLKCHYRHTVDGKPFERVGEKDITASVNFSFLEDEARARGFSARTVELSAFLIHAGAERFLTDESFAGEERQVLLRMLDPTGMGGLFKVCVLSKGCLLPPVKTWRELVGA